jgi:hypothetical protein
MPQAHLEYRRGELVAACRAYLALHMAWSKDASPDISDALMKVAEDARYEIKRLVNNEFQFHGSELGDPVQFALTVLLMAGEEHSASGQFR